MVDVDDAVGISIDEVFGKDLHVSRKDYKVDVVAIEYLKLALLHFGFVVAIDRNNFIWDIELLGDKSQVGMIAYDDGDFDVPLSGGVSCKDVVKTVGHL